MKRIHFIGIKGIGISGLACYLKKKGYQISGSDNKEVFLTDEILKRHKIFPKEFSQKNIKRNLDLIIYSSAYNRNHLERKKVKQLGLKEKSFFELLANIFNKKKNKILIAGTHGKTTTSALTAHVLKLSGFSPAAFIGGIVLNWKQNFLLGRKSFIVAEGDEYQDKFLLFNPDYLLITNIDYDHPDYFKNKKQYKNSFEKLKKQTQKKVFIGGKISSRFRKFLQKIDFPLLGEKNKQNAYLVYLLAKELKISDAKIKKAFSSFKGVKRRMEFYPSSTLQAPRSTLHASSFKFHVVDDYAHHPQEIKATLCALKEKYPDYKIIVFFQPHTFSRTKSLIYEFGKCFTKADFVYLLPTFSSAREKKPKQNIDKLLFNEIKKHHPKVESLPFNSNLLIYEINKLIQSYIPNSKFIILTMGAGDVYKLLSPI